MRRTSRPILIGALLLIFLTSACGELSFASPTPVWTLMPEGQPALPTTTLGAPLPTASTSTSMTVTPLIPITGENVVSLQCQFCVENEAHAVLIFPDFAYFDVSTETPVSCLTAAATGGKRILICHGPPSTTFNLNICSNPENCLQFPVALEPCPLLEAGATPLATATPYYLSPVNTLKAPRERTPAATAVPSRTPTPEGVPATSTPVPPTSPTSYSSGPLIVMGQWTR